MSVPVKDLEHVEFLVPQNTKISQDHIGALKSLSNSLNVNNVKCYSNLQKKVNGTLTGVSGISASMHHLTPETILHQNPSVTTVTLFPPSVLANSTIPEIRAFIDKNCKNVENLTPNNHKDIITLATSTLASKLKLKPDVISASNGPQLLFAPSTMTASLKTISHDGIDKDPHERDNKLEKDKTHWEASLGKGGSISIGEVQKDMDSLIKSLHVNEEDKLEGQSPKTLSEHLIKTKETNVHPDTKSTLAIVVTSNLSDLNEEYRNYWNQAIKKNKALTVGDMLNHPYHTGVLNLNVRNNARLIRQVCETLGIDNDFAWEKDTKSVYHNHPEFSTPLVIPQENVHHIQIANVSTPSLNSKNGVIHYNEVAFNPNALRQPTWSKISSSISMNTKGASNAKTIGTLISPIGDMVLWKPDMDINYAVQGPVSLFPKEKNIKITRDFHSKMDANFNQLSKLTSEASKSIVLQSLFMYEAPSI